MILTTIQSANTTVGDVVIPVMTVKSEPIKNNVQGYDSSSNWMYVDMLVTNFANSNPQKISFGVGAVVSVNGDNYNVTYKLTDLSGYSESKILYTAKNNVLTIYFKPVTPYTKIVVDIPVHSKINAIPYSGSVDTVRITDIDGLQSANLKSFNDFTDFLLPQNGFDGFVKFQNGLIVQWGRCYAVSSGTVINFPTAFSSACWGVFFGTWGSNVETLNVSIPTSVDRTKTGYTLKNIKANGEVQSYYGNWLAIGM